MLSGGSIIKHEYKENFGPCFPLHATQCGCSLEPPHKD